MYVCVYLCVVQDMIYIKLGKKRESTDCKLIHFAGKRLEGGRRDYKLLIYSPLFCLVHYNKPLLFCVFFFFTNHYFCDLRT